MFSLLPVFLVIMLFPVGSAIWSAVRYRRERRQLERAFRLGRERRLDPQDWQQ